ncbi:hypothetical protein QFZ77_007405 [Paenibacillus sp. V4I3]|nr:hypothetical protein [Paenibacillus sp. V4I3]MDQ0885401.1 hypothetical protein [Paenibacillus sp. V4I9]
MVVEWLHQYILSNAVMSAAFFYLFGSSKWGNPEFSSYTKVVVGN